MTDDEIKEARALADDYSNPTGAVRNVLDDALDHIEAQAVLLKRCRAVVGEYFEDVETLMFSGLTHASATEAAKVRAHVPALAALLNDLPPETT